MRMPSREGQRSLETWQNVHLQYTHGFGAVASQVNTATVEGQPVFTLQDIPPVGNPALEGDPSLVNSAPEGEGWFFTIVLTDKNDLEGLMDESAYKTFVAGL